MFIYYEDKDHFMSSEDLVILVKRIFTDFPEYYNLFSEQCLTYGDIVQKNTNSLLLQNSGVPPQYLLSRP
jgi:D-alanyl-D-alanine carboxypeptidase (penicillin-binding protein 5/6)